MSIVEVSCWSKLLHLEATDQVFRRSHFEARASGDPFGNVGPAVFHNYYLTGAVAVGLKLAALSTALKQLRRYLSTLRYCMFVKAGTCNRH